MTLQWRRWPPHALTAGPWNVLAMPGSGKYVLFRGHVRVDVFDSRTDALNAAERRHAAESVPIVESWDN